MSVPAVFFAFANDPGSHLGLLKQEASSVREVFRPLVEHGQLEFCHDETATSDEVFEALARLAGRLQVFHYAGHAGASSLKLEGGAASASGVAQLLGREEGLKLVFLNGCGTKPQVEALWNEGVPAVIATSVPIEDKKAAVFSWAFYQCLVHGLTLKEAFVRAGIRLRMDYGDDVRVGQVHRAVELVSAPNQNTPDGAAPWDLWMNPDGPSDVAGWRLPRVTESLSGDAAAAQQAGPDRALPTPLDEPVETRADDEIRLTSEYTPGLRGVKLCLRLEGKKMWWKRVEIGDPERKLDKTEFRPGIEGEGPGLKECMVVHPARPVILYFRKARTFGLKAGSVNEVFRDLTEYDGHTLTFSWISD